MNQRLSQKDRILQLLQERREQGIYVYEIMTPRPNGLGIAQYNARIKELREDGYRIVNVQPGHFVLENRPKYPEKKLEGSTDYQLAMV